jgi:MoaA/NifB/PqqE/SkfB family radical SAM enzyme
MNHDCLGGVEVEPSVLTWLVTTRCNAKCWFCSSPKIRGDSDLSLAEIESILPQLPRMDAVRLTGGEPFIRDDFAQIVDLCQSALKPMEIHITTNGSYAERIKNFLMGRLEGKRKQTKVVMMFSLDGRSEKHNAIRGPRIFERCEQLFEEFGPLQKKLNLELIVNMTVLDAESVEEYFKLRELLRSYGIRLQVVFEYSESSTFSLKRSKSVGVITHSAIGRATSDLKLTDSELSAFLSELRRDARTFPLFARIAKGKYYDLIEHYFLRPEEQGSPFPLCAALGSHMRMYPDGSIPTCQFNSSIVGDLRTQTFAEAFASDSWKAGRDWVRSCPGCWAECEAVPSWFQSLDFLLSTEMRVRLNSRAARRRGPRLKKPQVLPTNAPPQELVQLVAPTSRVK